MCFLYLILNVIVETANKRMLSGDAKENVKGKGKGKFISKNKGKGKGKGKGKRKSK